MCEVIRDIGMHCIEPDAFAGHYHSRCVDNITLKMDFAEPHKL